MTRLRSAGGGVSSSSSSSSSSNSSSSNSTHPLALVNCIRLLPGAVQLRLWGAAAHSGWANTQDTLQSCSERWVRACEGGEGGGGVRGGGGVLQVGESGWGERRCSSADNVTRGVHVWVTPVSVG